jgi:hypothetical protein
MPDLRGGRILTVEPAAPDLHVPRGWPCQAKTGTDLHLCGATPAATFRRICRHEHIRDVDMCATHQAAASLTGTCDRCATDLSGPHRCPIALIPVPAIR